jgi:hypothetical protein
MRRFIPLLVLGLGVAGACAGPGGDSGSSADATATLDPSRPLPSPFPEVVARINGQPIRFAQIVPLALQELERLPADEQAAGRPAAVRRALERYIDRELLFEEARSRGIRPNQRDLDWAYDQARREHPDDEAWRTFLAESGLDPRTFKTEMRIDHTVSALLEAEAGAWPSDDEARRAYEAKPEDFVPPGPGPPPFDDVRDQVKTLLRQQQIEEVSRLLLEDLRGRARIETFL